MAGKLKIVLCLALVAAAGCSGHKGKGGKAGATAALIVPPGETTPGPATTVPGPEGTAADDCAGKDCATLPFVHAISAGATFDQFASDDHQLGLFGRSVKFFVDARHPEAGRPIHFINANFKVKGAVPQSATLHYYFAREYLKIPEGGAEYNGVTYFTNAKRYFAGTVQRYHVDERNEDVYGIQFFPQDIASEQTILDAVTMVTQAFTAAGKKAFVAMGQQQTTAAVKAQIEALGVEVMTINDMLGSKDFLPLNPGEAWGYLRVFPQSPDDLRPTDIPVFDELPLDLTVVAGVITKAYQDPNSHVNLKSRERQTPNMMLRHAAPDAPELKDLDGKPVHLTVSMSGWKLEPSTDDEVKGKLALRLAKPWVPMSWDEELRLLSYDDMCSGEDPAACLKLKKRFGAKAANLGFLAQKGVLGRKDQPGTLSAELGYDLTPHGFGIPFSYYAQMLAMPENAAVQAAIDGLVKAEVGGALSPAERRQLADAVKALVLKAKLPDGMLAAVNAKIAEVLPGVPRVKLRSSANAEDVANFNGAGLYDSFKARPALTVDSGGECIVQYKANKFGATRAKLVPDTVECAIKAAYASLWNTRAIDERTFSRLAQGDAVMGIAVVAAYDVEAPVDANSVLITRVLNTDTLSGYSISTNKGNNLVTNPAPETYAEMALAVLLTSDVPTSITVTRFAKSKVDKPEKDKPVMSREQTLTMVEVAKRVEMAYCKASADYFPASRSDGTPCEYALWDENKPKALDFEFKLLKNGHFVAKQAREFSGAR
jgi:hypothetical protein